MVHLLVVHWRFQGERRTTESRQRRDLTMVAASTLPVTRRAFARLFSTLTGSPAQERKAPTELAPETLVRMAPLVSEPDPGAQPGGKCMRRTLLAMSCVLALAAVTAVAKEINLGKHSKDEIKNACNAHGGDLLGVSDSGSYGCEYNDTGTLILCNKNNECTGYVEARSKNDRTKLLGNLKVTAKPPVATPAAKPPK